MFRLIGYLLVGTLLAPFTLLSSALLFWLGRSAPPETIELTEDDLYVTWDDEGVETDDPWPHGDD